MPDKNKKLINDMYRMERDNTQESIRAQNRQNSKELEESARMRQESLQKEIVKGSNSKNPINMGSPLYGKISSAKPVDLVTSEVKSNGIFTKNTYDALCCYCYALEALEQDA